MLKGSETQIILLKGWWPDGWFKLSSRGYPNLTLNLIHF